MSIKDLFEEKIASSPAANKSLDEVGQEAESADYIKRYVEEREKFVPHVDFSKPENFARFGLAEKYYDDSIKRIYQQYPYDGSLKEKVEWHISSSYLDNHIFENEYPRTNGYVNLGLTGQAGTPAIPLRGGGDYSWANPAYQEFIEIKGGPNKDPDNTALKKIFPSDGGQANIYDVSENRESNLELDFANNGVTVEFWLNKQAFNVGSKGWKKEAIFDVWNGVATSSSDYGRLTIELSGTTASESPFYITAQSGTAGAFNQQIGVSIAGTGSLTSWNHYAFSFVSASSGVETKFYVNGDLNQTAVLGTSGIGEVTGSLIANIGCLRTPPSGNIYDISGMGTPAEVAILNRGVANLSASMDEFRFWKTKRSSQQIGRHWFTQVGGGTNTDIANTDLGIYFKFNEGITTNDSTDAVVLDYSGRISNGSWTGYTAAARSTESAMVLSNAAATEFKDPIIYSSHPDVLSYTSDKRLVGREHDFVNNSSIFNSYPSWIQEDDGDDGELKKLSQVMSSYLDTLYNQIEALPTLRNVNYLSSSASASFKPYPFSNKLLISMGLNAPNLFENAEIIEQFLNRDEDRNYEIKLADIKNNIYNNIYNNLVYIYKSKGTEKAFRNMIRCFGVDDELIKVNLYADNETYVFEDRYRETSFRNTYADFNDPTRFSATVHQFKDTSNTNTVSFLSASAAQGLESGSALTVEAEIVLPEKFLNSSVYFFDTPFSKSCLFGMHTADPALSENNLTFASSDVANFQVFAVRNDNNSANAKFMITGSAGGYVPEISSSIFLDAYNNERWNIAVRIKPSKYPFVGSVVGTEDQTYEINLYGANATFGTIQNEFEVTGTVTHAQGMEILSNPKRIFAGAHYQNFTGSILNKTDVKVGSVRVWNDYLPNEALRAHAIDPSNYGAYRTYKRPFLFEDNLTTTNISEIETLALHWTFDTLTGSDASGQFIVPDFSSGSSADNRHGWVSNVVNRQHSGRGYEFSANSTDSLDKDYTFAYRQQLPEVLYSADTVNVLSRDDEVFTREKRPIKHYIAIEKSVYQEISNDMLKMFATIVDFNNLIGEPVNRYRQEYKDLGKLRQLFYEKVRNTPDFQKFVDFYKWFDGATNEILQQLMPASAATSGEIRTMIESHILERNKYWNKFPTLEAKVSDPEAGLNGVNELLYNWRYGHAPVSSQEGENCFWWNEKAEREGAISSGDTNVDSDRSRILTSSLQVLNRRFTTPHRLLVKQSTKLKGGVGFHQNKKLDLFKTEALPVGAGNSLTASFVDYFTDCSDVTDPNKKTRVSLEVKGLSVLDGEAKGEMVLPFSVHSSSANPNFAVATDKEITNIHSDFYETALQGAFTKQHVGGAQHRNIGVIENLISSSNNNTLSRPELFRLKINGSTVTVHGADRDESGNLNLHLPRATFFRDETAQRSLNLRNIKSSTSKGILGNYSSVREIVQTSNRKTNNKWFIYSGSAPGLATPSILFDDDSFKVGTGSVSSLEVVEYTKPVRGRTEHVIVERFSAPGGPETAGDANGGPGLDAFSAEYSIYNTMNYRNLLTREVLNELSTEHAGQFGIDKDSAVRAEDYATSSAFHKVNRNTLRRLEYSGTGTDVVTASVRDNLFIQHPIPQGDLGYAWITSSAISAPLGFATDPRRLPNDADTITFLSASENNAGAVPVDFVGLNTYIYDPVVDNENILSSSNSVYRNTSIATITAVEAHNALNLHRNGPYGYPIFKQIRTGQHPIARDQKKNNKLQYIAPPSPGQLLRVQINNLPTLQVVTPRPERRKTFVEPALSSKFKPMRHTLELATDHGINKTFTLKHTYGNNTSYFANEALNNNLVWHMISEDRGLPNTNSRQIYNDITDLYTNDESDASNPVKSFKSLRYRETIYPRATNAFLERTRSRINYDVGSILGWRDSKEDRIQYGASNELGTSEHKSVPTASTFVITSSMWPLDQPTGSVYVTASWLTSAGLGGADLSGGYSAAGVLQNDYSTWHNGDVLNIKPAPTYARAQIEVAQLSAVSNYPMWIIGGRHPWTAPTQAGKNPFYDTYNDFAQDIKRIGKDFSIIPEFTISDHMEYYVEQNNGNFLVDPPSSLFSLLGANASSSADTTATNGSKFFKLYSSSEFLKHFEIIDNDHLDIEGGFNKDLTLSCKAIKKFRPREGFYPAQRTLQLATLFSQSYATTVELTGTQPSLRTFYTPFFAPGIMYNTIKSGVAVDYPVMTASFNVLDTTFDVSNNVEVYPFRGGDSTNESLLRSSMIFRSIDDRRTFMISSSFHSRIPFEAIVDPDMYISAGSVSIFDAEPHPSASLDCTASLGGVGTRLYKLAANNFFAEAGSFFLADKRIGTFSSFISKPGSKISRPLPGVKYKMDVIMTAQSEPIDVGLVGLSAGAAWSLPSYFKSIAMYQQAHASTLGNNIVSLRGYSRDFFNHISTNLDFAFGPPVLEFSSSTAARYGANDVKFHRSGAPFTPPYYDGPSRVTFEFNPRRGVNYSISTILEELTSSYSREGVLNVPGSASFAYQSAMHISSSVNLDGLIKNKVIETDEAGQIISIRDAEPGTETADNAWVIESKFETPILDFHAAEVEAQPALRSAPRGMWHQYGQIPDSTTKGIFLQISDSEAKSSDDPFVASLADLVGFPTEDRTKRLGEVATARKVKEAVVAIPFLRGTGTDVSQMQFIPTPADQAMIEKLKQYVFPPQFDFTTGFSPVVMYIFEFEHEFKQQDLVDMWQNLPPDELKIAKGNIASSSDTTNLLERLKQLDRSLKDVQWMVFKVKQRASYNYFDKTLSTKDDERSVAIGAEDNNGLKYSYNWPYDYFSLVELVKIDAEVEYTDDEGV